MIDLINDAAWGLSHVKTVQLPCSNDIPKIKQNGLIIGIVTPTFISCNAICSFARLYCSFLVEY